MPASGDKSGAVGSVRTAAHEKKKGKKGKQQCHNRTSNCYVC